MNGLLFLILVASLMVVAFVLRVIYVLRHPDRDDGRDEESSKTQGIK